MSPCAGFSDVSADQLQPAHQQSCRAVVFNKVFGVAARKLETSCLQQNLWGFCRARGLLPSMKSLGLLKGCRPIVFNRIFGVAAKMQTCCLHHSLRDSCYTIFGVAAELQTCCLPHTLSGCCKAAVLITGLGLL